MMEKKKILLLGKLPPPFMGPALATKILLESELKNRFVLLHIDTRAYDTLSELGKWKLKKLVRNFRIYRRFLKTCKVDKPDLVLVPISQATAGFLKDSLFILLGAWTGRKVIIQLRGSDFQNWLGKSSRPVRSYVRFVLKKTEGVIVLGNRLRNLFRDYFPDEKIYVVPNGANYPLNFRMRGNGLVKILYLANLQASKGIEDVLDAVSLLCNRKLTKFRLDVMGTWRSESTRKKCIGQVEAEALPVTFHPANAGSEKFRFYDQADIFVFTPRAPEGHPWVIVESMAAGLPIVSTDQGAISECVLEGRNGFIVPAGDPEAIARRLEDLIMNSGLRERMGKESRRLYEEKFTEQKMVEQMAQTFNTVIAG